MNSNRLLLIWSGAVNPVWYPYFIELSKHFQLRVLTPKTWVHGSVTFTASENSSEFELVKTHFIKLGGGKVIIAGMLPHLFFFRPTHLYFMDEPDRLLTALQISFAKKLFPLTRMVIYALQNIPVPAYYSWTHSLSHRISKNQCNAVIAATNEAKDILLQRGYTHPIKVIPLFASKVHFYPPTKERKKSLRNQYDIANGDILMCYAGSLDPAKGVFKWIAALTHYPRVRLFIASQDNWPSDILLNYRHRFMGPIIGADLRHLFQASDYVILPSIGNTNWKEQIGRILLEGILCGAIGLGSNIGPIPELLLDERAIFDPESPISLDNLLSQLPWPDSEKIQAKQRQHVLCHYEAEVVGLATAQFLLQLEKT